MKDEGRFEPTSFEREIYKNWERQKYFKATVDSQKTPYCIIMPPPNVTSRLHMGHAFQETIQDVIIRRKRMQGFSALWLPGSDHAAIATEAKVVEKLKKQGLTKDMLGREKFQAHIDEWYKEYKGAIIDQFKVMGFSCDWDRLAFTMDEQNCRAVREVFVRLYKKGWIYRGDRIVNWCTYCKTSISDAEVDHQENHTKLWHIKYQVENSNEFLIVATTRPETLFGDTAVAVNPKDKRYKHLVGKNVVLPLVNKPIPVIADSYTEMAFGTGVVKITPAHDSNDFKVGERHNLPVVKVFDDDGKLNSFCGKFAGIDRLDAREKVVNELHTIGSLIKEENYDNNVGHCDRCHHPIETMVSKQWFVKMSELAKPAIKVVEDGSVKFAQDRYKKSYLHWMRNINDWCISRQLWSGHKIPIFYCDKCGEVIVESEDPKVCPVCKNKNLRQDTDTLDTWFSSALWPFSTLGWPDDSKDLKYFYPTDVLVTDRGIINLWVARMIFCGIEFVGDIPFKNVLINGTVNDEFGRKMSKSLGNGVDPAILIDKFGADTLRYSIINGIAIDADSRFSTKKVELSSAFMNKIWNTAKFVSIHSEGCQILGVDQVNLSDTDKWILDILNKTIKTVNKNFEKFDLGIALSNTTAFVLDQFCDYYIEMCKPRLFDGNDKQTAVSVLNFVFEQILKLLHPFVPMTTEYIYQRMDFVGKGETIMLESFPEYKKSFVFKKATENVSKVIALIKGIRNLRKQNQIADNKKIRIAIFSSELKLIESHQHELKKLANIDEIKILSSKQNSGNATYSFIMEKTEIYLLADDFDRTREIQKLDVEIERMKAEIERGKKLLSNPGFIDKAPKNLIDIERKKLDSHEEMYAKLCDKRKNL